MTVSEKTHIRPGFNLHINQRIIKCREHKITQEINDNNRKIIENIQIKVKIFEYDLNGKTMMFIILFNLESCVQHVNLKQKQKLMNI